MGGVICVSQVMSMIFLRISGAFSSITKAGSTHPCTLPKQPESSFDLSAFDTLCHKVISFQRLFGGSVSRDEDEGTEVILGFN